MKEYRQVNTWGPRLCYVAVKSDTVLLKIFLFLTLFLTLESLYICFNQIKVCLCLVP